MTTLSPHSPDILRHLREYAALYQLYIVNTEQNQLPPLHIRTSFKRCESCLPTGLVQYVLWLHKCGISNPLTILDSKGRCAACRQATNPEWQSSTVHGKVIYFCAGCGRIFIPEHTDQEVMS